MVHGSMSIKSYNTVHNARNMSDSILIPTELVSCYSKIHSVELI